MPQAFTYIQNGITYNNVTRPVAIIEDAPAGSSSLYTVSGTNVESMSAHNTFNVIEFTWNGAQLPNNQSVSGANMTINTTADLLNYVKNIRLKLNNYMYYNSDPIFTDDINDGYSYNYFGDNMSTTEDINNPGYNLNGYDMTEEDPLNPGYDYYGNEIGGGSDDRDPADFISLYFTSYDPSEGSETQINIENNDTIVIDLATYDDEAGTYEIEYNGSTYIGGCPSVANVHPINNNYVELYTTSDDDSIAYFTENTDENTENYWYDIMLGGATGPATVHITYFGDEYYAETTYEYSIEVIDSSAE